MSGKMDKVLADDVANHWLADGREDPLTLSDVMRAVKTDARLIMMRRKDRIRIWGQSDTASS